MARRKIKTEAGWAAVRAIQVAPNHVAAADLATAVRFLLEELAEIAPGSAVEVRIPPFGATQCIEGPRHVRGNPANVVEMSPEIWFAVATGSLDWSEAIAAGKISVSGARADLGEVLPLL